MRPLTMLGYAISEMGQKVELQWNLDLLKWTKMTMNLDHQNGFEKDE